MKISVVIPVFNEEESINELHNQLLKALSYCKDYEIIFIDDGSYDDSFKNIVSLADKNKKIKVIQFFRNYGKSAALSEGFRYCSGDYVITLDADLQDDPYEIKNLISEIDKGYDLVSGWKKDRKDPLSKKIPSKFFNMVTRLSTGVLIHDFNCGLKAYKKSVVKSIDIYGGRHRYIPALAGQKKFKVSELIVNHRQRLYGETKYGGSRFFHGFFDLISILFLSKYTQSPLYFFGKIGFFTFAAGLIIELYVLYLKYFLNESFSQHIALLIFGVLILIIGIQFFSIGLIGEMIANSNHSKQLRIKKFINK